MNLTPLLEEYLSARKSDGFFDEKPFYDKLKLLDFSTFECNEILKELDAEWELMKSFQNVKNQFRLLAVFSVLPATTDLILARFGLIPGRIMNYSVLIVGFLVVACSYSFQKMRTIEKAKNRMELRWGNR